MDQKTIDAIAEAVAARILPRWRVPVTPEYLTTEQVSQMTGISPKALEEYRATGAGAPFLKVGRAVRYRAADVRAWMEAMA